MNLKESVPIIGKERYQNIINEALKGDRKIPTDKMSLMDWLAIRNMAGIGASEVAAVLGFNKWETPFQVWKRKVSDEIDIEENDFMIFGREFEPAILKLYEKQTKTKVVKDNFLRFHPKYDCLFANLDGVFPDGTKGLVECKSTIRSVYKSWDNNEEDCVQGVPLYYYAQCQHELSVTGFEWCDLTFLIADARKIAIKRIMRDDKYIKSQDAALVRFWDAYVVPMVAPEFEASEISLLDPAEGSFIEADEETVNLVSMLKEAKTELKNAEKKKDLLQDSVIKKIGDKESLTSGGSVLATFKQQSRTTLQTDLIKQQEPEIFDRFGKTTTFRMLRIK